MTDDDMIEVGPDTELIPDRGKMSSLDGAPQPHPFQDSTEWSPVQLPSHGIFYGGKCPGGQAWITPWTTAQEIMMVRSGDIRPDELAEQLIVGNTRFPGELRYEDLLLTDEFFLLVQLRIESLTALYSFDVQCPQCRKRETVTVDLRSLSCRVPFTEEGVQDIPSEPITVTLPKSRREVGLNFLRVRDKRRIALYKAKKDDGSDLLYQHALRISEVDGQPMRFADRQDFLKGLTMKDLRVMDAILEKYETGLLFTHEYTCSNRRCGFRAETVVPTTDGFFRPGESDLLGEVGLIEAH